MNKETLNTIVIFADEVGFVTNPSASIIQSQLISIANAFCVEGYSVIIAADITMFTPVAVAIGQQTTIDNISYINLGQHYDTQLVWEKLNDIYKNRILHIISFDRSQALLESRQLSNVKSRSLISTSPLGNIGTSLRIIDNCCGHVFVFSPEQKELFTEGGLLESKIVILDPISLQTGKGEKLTKFIIEDLATIGNDINKDFKIGDTAMNQDSRSKAGKKKVGLLTTYNQRCGLATYAKYLATHLHESDIVILAEDVPSEQLISFDGANVKRCWKRGSNDFNQLSQVIEQENIDVLHLNCHYRFFSGEVFGKFLSLRRRKGMKVIAHVHNPYTLDDNLRHLVQNADRVIVHTEENKLEVIANGAVVDSVDVIEHGIELCTDLSKLDARKHLGIATDEQVAVCFGFVQPHKGIDEAISAINKLRENFPKLHLYVVGGAHDEDVYSRDYLKSLKGMVETLHLRERVHFIEGFVPETTVQEYLVSADVVLMNYRSQHYEASGAVARALGAGVPIVTSSAPAFARLGNAVFHLTSGYPLPLVIALILTNDELAETLKDGAKKWREQFSWANIAIKFTEVYGALAARQIRTIQPRSVKDAASEIVSVRSNQLRVLMQNRSFAFSHRGGDTVVMERLAAGLQQLGATVAIDVDSRLNPKDFDLVHLFNFATPDITRRYAEKCVEANVPFVVTTMYEDLPLFYNQMLGNFEIMRKYINDGQPANNWEAYAACAKNITPSTRWENSWTSSEAAALIASGERERQTLLRDYPNSKRVVTYRLGCDVVAGSQDEKLFKERTGLDDFILCVGRLETRKNQLMLLKAFENSEMTIVFVTGGFTYQPEYEEACKKFKRRGQTVFLGRLEPQLLASAFAAAKVHALPSWYELPGIVSMEAARYGSNIVVTDFGTVRDYFGDFAYYCSPDNPESIFNAVVAAYYAPTRRGLVESIGDCTWDNSAKQVLAIYNDVLSEKLTSRKPSYELPEWKNQKVGDVVTKELENTYVQALDTANQVLKIPAAVDKDAILAESTCDEGDVFAKDKKLDRAVEKYQEILTLNPKHVRALRSMGVVALQSQRLLDATQYFTKALAVESGDVKSLTGLGATRWAEGKKYEGFALFQQALTLDPGSLPSLLHLVQASYELNELRVLERGLERFLEVHPENLDIQYCLAGCLFKQNRFTESEAIIDSILDQNPNHEAALELKVKLESIPLQDVPLLADQVTCDEVTDSLPLPLYTNDIDRQLQELEKWKKQHRFVEILENAEGIITNPDVSKDQRDHAQVISGEAAACVGSFQKGREMFQAIDSASSYYVRALVGLGAVSAAGYLWPEAAKYFDLALLQQPDNDAALAGKGMCLVERGDTDNAWASYQRALDKNPENIRAIYGVIQLGYRLNRLEEVEKAISFYLDYHPANLDMLYAFAGCKYAQGNIGVAVECLEKVRVFDPNHKLACELLEKIRVEGHTGEEVRI